MKTCYRVVGKLQKSTKPYPKKLEAYMFCAHEKKTIRQLKLSAEQRPQRHPPPPPPQKTFQIHTFTTFVKPRIFDEVATKKRISASHWEIKSYELIST